jgi:hypothetical protein
MSAPTQEHEHEAAAAPVPHDPAHESAHAWKEFRRDAKFFSCFFGVILLTFLAFNINFPAPWNMVAIFFFAAARSLLIALFFVSLIGHFSLVIRTMIFTALFFAGMVFLSLWDSMLPTFGDPILLPDKSPVSTHH